MIGGHEVVLSAHLLQQFIECRLIVFLNQFRMEDCNEVFKQKVRMDRGELVVRGLLHVAVDDLLVLERVKEGVSRL